MRVTSFLFSAAVVLLALGMKTNQATRLDGTWIPVKQEIAGALLAPANFVNQKLVISDSTYIFTAESVDKGIARYRGGKMDIFGREGVNTGRHFTAIYKLTNDTLSICYNLTGAAYPDSFDTQGKRGFFLSVFKKSN